MTKVEMARKIVADNPNASRGELIGKFMLGLGMSKAGATTYYYNVTKGAPKAERKAKAVKAPKVAKVKSKQTKEQRLELIRQVAAKRGADGFMTNDPIRETYLRDNEDYVKEAQQYVREHAPKYIREELGLD